MAEWRRVVGVVAACPFPLHQGSQVLIRQISGALSRRGHPVHLVTYPAGDSEPEPSCFLHRAPSLVPYRKRDPGPSLLKPLLDLLLLARTVSIGRREGFHILHGHNYEGLLVGWLAAGWLGIPLVYFRHSRLADELPTYFSRRLSRWLARRLGLMFDRFAELLPDHVITVTPGERGPKTTVLPPGIDPGEWMGIDRGRPEGDRRPTLIYTGNLARFQNMPDLLQAVRRVREEVPDIRLLVVTPSDPTGLVDLARATGLVEHLSIVEERDFTTTRRLLLEADLACSTRTMSTGFPIKHLNYMAAGLPIVCYRGGAKGVVDGETGTVVEDGDVPAFARAVTVLLRDESLRREMGERSREIVFRDYRWDALIEVVEGIHARLLADSPRRKRPGE